jgi:hypothetical protein
MAMQMEVNLSNGIELTEAYLVISKMVFSYTDINSVDIQLSVYKDAYAFNNGKPEVLYFTHTCSGNEFESYFSYNILNVESNNHINRAYAWLLNLDAYSTAVEV